MYDFKNFREKKEAYFMLNVGLFTDFIDVNYLILTYNVSSKRELFRRIDGKAFFEISR